MRNDREELQFVLAGLFWTFVVASTSAGFKVGVVWLAVWVFGGELGYWPIFAVLFALGLRSARDTALEAVTKMLRKARLESMKAKS